tara:strand:- start:175 stop:378 length:204 start_codon:yes stop_codon:yes gene_type:complete
MKTNDFSNDRDDLSKNSYRWDIKPFVDEDTIPKMMEELQKDGWEVFYIDLSESKLIIRKPIQVRLDD